MSQTTHAQHKVKRSPRRQGLWIVAVVDAAMTAAGRGTSASPPATGTATPTATETTNAIGSLKGIPFYQPSTVRSHTGDSVVLTSPDSVTKVSDFYLRTVDTGGWTMVSKSVTPYNGNLSIKKSGQGATISVAPAGSGSAITISTYPTA